jgi:hypothetical protein
MNRRTQQLLNDLAEARPIPPDETWRVAPLVTREAMFERIVHPSNLRTVARRRRRMSPRLLPLTAATAAFVVVAALAIGLLPGRGPGGAPPASALELAARTAAAQPYREPGPGERWYQKEVTVSDKGTKDQLRSVIENWYAKDGTVWMRASYEGGGHSERGRIERVDNQGGTQPHELGYKELKAFPTDPAAAAARLRQLEPSPEGGGIVELAFHYLAIPVLNPAQRAALFRVLASAPGMQVTEGVKGPSGQPATRVSTVTVNEEDPKIKNRVEFLFDPATSQILSLRGKSITGDPSGHRPGQIYVEATFDPWRIVPDPLG